MNISPKNRFLEMKSDAEELLEVFRQLEALRLFTDFGNEERDEFNSLWRVLFARAKELSGVYRNKLTSSRG